jgi:UPF0716 protein FxsA
MMFKLALLFVGLPLLELAVLVWIGSTMGFWPTMALVLLTGIAGALLARLAGVQVLMQVRGEMAAGRMPVGHMLDGLLVLVGGVVLLTPGLISDVFGFALLIPASRRFFKRLLQSRLRKMVEARQVEIIGGRAIHMDFTDPGPTAGPRDVTDLPGRSDRPDIRDR